MRSLSMFTLAMYGMFRSCKLFTHPILIILLNKAAYADSYNSGAVGCGYRSGNRIRFVWLYIHVFIACLYS